MAGNADLLDSTRGPPRLSRSRPRARARMLAVPTHLKVALAAVIGSVEPRAHDDMGARLPHAEVSDVLQCLRTRWSALRPANPSSLRAPTSMYGVWRAEARLGSTHTRELTTEYDVRERARSADTEAGSTRTALARMGPPSAAGATRHPPSGTSSVRSGAGDRRRRSEAACVV